MDLNYNVFVNKTKIMLKTIKKEYEIIIQNYSEEKIIKKSYSIKSRDSLNNKEKEYADSILEQFFEPSLKQISILIDSGIISWDSAIEPISLNDINKDIKDFKHLIYESWEKLYVYKHIKYDLIMSFIIQILVFCFSLWLDDYHFQNYHVYPENDGHAYIYLEKEKDIEQLYKEVKDENDYKHDGYISYDYSKIRADKLEYGVVRKAFFLSIIVSFSLGFILVFVLIGLYVIIEQIIHFNKNYTRTIKGKILLNKAYALKNYLSKYSLIKNRTEKELILWEYYLIYAVVLNVNVKIKDEIIEKYVSEI